MPNPPIPGLHHVTAISGSAQQNVDFYAGVLGQRLVKRTVNFDDPGTYHLYYGDGAGSPGTILTFFPWAGVPRGTRGAGEVGATAYAIAPGSVGYWLERFKAARVPCERLGARFEAEEVIRFSDPDGMGLELVADASAVNRFTPATWPGSPVPPEHALRGFHGGTAVLEGYELTAKLLTDTLGFRLAAERGNRFRYLLGDDDAADAAPGRALDLVCSPHAGHARPGAGSVHHIALRVPDAAAQLAWRETLVSQGYDVSPVMDRDYFHSIYFREPGGVLFEIATDPPGFTADEPLDELGTGLKLPRWLEPRRALIETKLPPLTMPSVSASGATTN